MSQVDVKVVLLGKEYCGKTSLVERILNHRFAGENRYQNTIGAAYGSKTVAWEEEVQAKRKGGSRARRVSRSVVLGLWDTAGSERYFHAFRLQFTK